MTEKSRMEKLRTVFDWWVRVDQENCDLEGSKVAAVSYALSLHNK